MTNEKISKPEDQIIRRWIRNRFGVKVPQWALWNLTPREAVEYLKEEKPAVFPKLTAADIEKAARRN